MFFLSRWFLNIFERLGLRNKKARIVFLGLDNAGKTTLMHVLRDDRIKFHEPTRHPQQEELTIGSIRFSAHDLGGHKAARRIWKTYLTDVDGIIFLVDTTDHRRFSEAREELSALLSSTELQKVPFLILGNKIDAKEAVSERILKHELGIHHTTGKQSGSLPFNAQPIEVFMCSVVKRVGFQEGFKWLSEYIA